VDSTGREGWPNARNVGGLGFAGGTLVAGWLHTARPVPQATKNPEELRSPPDGSATSSHQTSPTATLNKEPKQGQAGHSGSLNGSRMGGPKQPGY